MSNLTEQRKTKANGEAQASFGFFAFQVASILTDPSNLCQIYFLTLSNSRSELAVTNMRKGLQGW